MSNGPTYQRAFVKKRAFSSLERAVATGADLPFGRHHHPTWTADISGAWERAGPDDLDIALPIF